MKEDVKATRLRRLLELRTDKFSGSSAALAGAIKRSPSQVSQWFTGVRTITEDSARHIEHALRLQPGWLDGADQASRATEEPANLAATTDHDGSVKVPMLAVTASMGRGEDQPGEDIVTGTIAVSSDWVAQQLRIDPARLRFINGYGDSMAPTFNSGDVLLVDTGTTSVVVDGIYVLATDSRLFIKRVRERLDGRYEISSDNPLVKTVDELDGGHEVDVLGRVVWVWNGKKV